MQELDQCDSPVTRPLRASARRLDRMACERQHQEQTAPEQAAQRRACLASHAEAARSGRREKSLIEDAHLVRDRLVAHRLGPLLDCPTPSWQEPGGRQGRDRQSRERRPTSQHQLAPERLTRVAPRFPPFPQRLILHRPARPHRSSRQRLADREHLADQERLVEWQRLAYRQRQNHREPVLR